MTSAYPKGYRIVRTSDPPKTNRVIMMMQIIIVVTKLKIGQKIKQGNSNLKRNLSIPVYIKPRNLSTCKLKFPVQMYCQQYENIAKAMAANYYGSPV